MGGLLLLKHEIKFWLHFINLFTPYMFRTILNFLPGFYHRSAFGVMLTGIALNSVLMHKNSPDTHIIVIQTMFINHHVIVFPNEKLL